MTARRIIGLRYHLAISARRQGSLSPDQFHAIVADCRESLRRCPR